MRDCIRESSTSVWVAAAGLVAERYGAVARARWVVLGLTARGWLFLLVSFLLFVSTWHALSRRKVTCAVCKVRSAALPISLWTFGWFSFALVPLHNYFRLRLVAFAILSVLPAIGQFAVCGFWSRRRWLYWGVLYSAAALLLVGYPFLPGASPGWWTMSFFLAILSIAVPGEGEGAFSWNLPAVVFFVSLQMELLSYLLGLRTSLLRGMAILFGYLVTVWFLQAIGASRSADRTLDVVQESS